MARQSEGAWYRKAKDAWYATVGGRKVSLGVKGKANRKAAQEAWHRLMAEGETTNTPRTKGVKEESVSVRLLTEAFIADASLRLKAPTLRLYRVHLESLCRWVGTLRADKLTSSHLSRWLAGLEAGSTTKGMMLRSASACLGWAERNGMLPENVAKRVPKPKSRSRSEDAVISEADHVKMLALASPQFRPVLTVLHATGCRPGEACRITSETFDASAGVVKLAEHKGDRTGKPRLIFLPPDVAALLRGLAGQYNSGPLLRTAKGKAWTNTLINQQVRRLAKRAGIGSAMPYGYRHGFATAALVAGVPDAQVAALLGHSSTAMVHRHYSHLTSQAQAMREALAKVRG